MFRERIPGKQLCAWIFTATVPVLIQLLGGSSWPWIAIVGGVSVLLTLIVWHSGWKPLKWQCPFLLIYIMVLLSQLLRRTAESWPVGDSDPWVGLILLAVAAWSAQKGPSAAARVGTVLFWVVLLLYFGMFGAAIKDVKLSWLQPNWDLPNELGLVVLLIPVMSVCLLRNGRKIGGTLYLMPMTVLVAALLCAGVLSPAVAVKTTNAFYEMSRGVNLLGVARRFEAVICAGMTVGWFAVMSLLLTVGGMLFHKQFERWGRGGVWLIASGAAAAKLCGLHIQPRFLLIVGAVFWVAVPLITQGLGKIKKS